MSRPHRVQAVVPLALGGSLAAHATLFWLVNSAIVRHSRDHAAAQQPQMVAIMLPQELKLGVDALSPTPTETWVGHKRPDELEHLAPPSEVEQAAFTDQPPQPPPSPSQQQPAPPIERESAPNRATETLGRLPDELQSATNALTERLKSIEDFLESMASAAPTLNDAPAEEMTEPQAEAAASAPEASQQATAAPASSVQFAEPEPGEPADKQSPATSIIEVPPDQWRLGKPLATEGLELKTRRPTMTVLTMMTASPGNPLCSIEFDRSGVPRNAALVESTGDPRVDSAILASLYRWRAAGSDLEQLTGERTLTVTLRLLLRR